MATTRRDHTGPHTDDVKRYIFNFEIDNELRVRTQATGSS
jgi:hypothetical protein